MYPFEIILLAGVVMLLSGGVLGFLVARSWMPADRQRSLEQQVVSAKSDLDEYQKNVARHFLETSQKVSEVTQSYRELHEHLAKGALELANTEIGRKVIEAGEVTNIDRLEQVHIEAPRDWAPRMPGERGMLSEEFGLKEQDSPAPDDAPSERPGQ